MRNCAVITEYNPFHTGHKYQLNALNAKGFNDIFCVMSGPFVQSAMPAFCDKALRAECAVLGGASAVIELPTVYATASAQLFAEGGLKIISGIKNVTHLAMGGVGNGDDILRLADVKISHSERFTQELKAELERGKSYNAASVTALTRIYGNIYPDRPTVATLLKDPNNILCVEYITAINKYCANIQPLIIERRGAAYNDLSADGEFVSATAIRTADECGKIHTMRKYIPFHYDEICDNRKHHTADIELYKKLTLFALKKATTDEISKLRNCSEGLEYSLKKLAHLNNLDEIVNAVVGKRYGKKRLYRLFLDLHLGIEKGFTDNAFCTRLLACKNSFNFSQLPNYIKTTNAQIKTAAKNCPDVQKVLKIDENATNLYNTLSDIIGDYFNYSVIKV
ncbi:MAG: nucleotidyltransferase family protein [Clostridiales bacterium]|nr:nucleotidyltransferase family protein [Clostridiales bacterium]